MSADNWARCPRCMARESDELEARRAEVDAAYGKVPVDEFDARRAALAAHEDALRKLRPTFREDYEFYGAETGTVTASYSGSCSLCGLSLRFEDSHPIPDWEKRGKR